MLVLDASVFISALFPDEKQHMSLALYQMIVDEKEEAMVPPVFAYEVCNVVIHSLRRRRIDEQTASEYLDLIYSFPSRVDRDQDISDVVSLARKHSLTTYDAAYLELCKRQAIPLATLDKALATAAKKERIEVLA